MGLLFVPGWQWRGQLHHSCQAQCLIGMPVALIWSRWPTLQLMLGKKPMHAVTASGGLGTLHASCPPSVNVASQDQVPKTTHWRHKVPRVACGGFNPTPKNPWKTPDSFIACDDWKVEQDNCLKALAHNSRGNDLRCKVW
jgi:hypothetical protein